MELFEAFFGGGVFDGSEDEYWQDQEYYQQQQKQQQHQQQQFYQEMPWIGQDFEQYHDYEDAGEMYRRVITTVVYGDGTSRSTAQDYLLDRASDRWHVASPPFEYHGPGVGRSFGGVGGGRGDETVDNVLRMNEFLRVGHSITSVDRKFTAVLDHTCNFAVVRNKGRGMDRAKVWETGSFEAEGRCFAMIQDNGMFVVMAGVDPSAPGNVLWSNNQGYVGWFRQNSFHAAVLPNGNLVVSQGESPMHPAARSCVWGAFGCPGEGGVMEWKLVWISFRSKAGMVWCKVVGCGDDGQNNSDGGGYRNDSSDYSSSAYSKWWGGHGKGAPAAILKRAASQGVAYLKEAWGKVKAAAEETADAASRPRHW